MELKHDEEAYRDAHYVEYFVIQRGLVSLLRDMGVRYNGTDRLPLFWLRARLEKIAYKKHKDNIANAIELIDTLVEYRRSGFEPPHKYGKYT